MVDLVKWVVSGTLGFLLLYHRNGFWLSIVIGALSNGLLVKILKRLFKIPRPKGSDKTDPGMPSSHAHMLSYFASMAFFSNADPLITGFLFLFSIFVSFLRIRRGIHNLEQCTVGLITGFLGAVIWSYSPFHAPSLLRQDVLVHQSNSVVIAFCFIFGFLILGKPGRYLSGYAEE